MVEGHLTTVLVTSSPRRPPSRNSFYWNSPVKPCNWSFSYKAISFSLYNPNVAAYESLRFDCVYIWSFQSFKSFRSFKSGCHMIATIATIAEKFSDRGDHLETALQRSSQRQQSAIVAIMWKPANATITTIVQLFCSDRSVAWQINRRIN